MNANTKVQENAELELREDELHEVSGGRKAGGHASTAGQEFLKFRFETVFTT